MKHGEKHIHPEEEPGSKSKSGPAEGEDKTPVGKLIEKWKEAEEQLRPLMPGSILETQRANKEKVLVKDRHGKTLAYSNERMLKQLADKHYELSLNEKVDRRTLEERYLQWLEAIREYPNRERLGLAPVTNTKGEVVQVNLIELQDGVEHVVETYQDPYILYVIKRIDALNAEQAELRLEWAKEADVRKFFALQKAKLDPEVF